MQNIEGRHHLWILPNLTEDCGFFESFKPFYTYEYVSSNGSEVEKKKKKTASDKESSEEKGGNSGANECDDENYAADANATEAHAQEPQHFNGDNVEKADSDSGTADDATCSDSDDSDLSSQHSSMQDEEDLGSQLEEDDRQRTDGSGTPVESPKARHRKKNKKVKDEQNAEEDEKDQEYQDKDSSNGGFEVIDAELEAGSKH